MNPQLIADLKINFIPAKDLTNATNVYGTVIEHTAEQINSSKTNQIMVLDYVLLEPMRFMLSKVTAPAGTCVFKQLAELVAIAEQDYKDIT